MTQDDIVHVVNLNCQEENDMEKEIRRRPGRKLGAEKRRAARKEIEKLVYEKEFTLLDRKYQVAIMQLVPGLKEPSWEERELFWGTEVFPEERRMRDAL